MKMSELIEEALQAAGSVPLDAVYVQHDSDNPRIQAIRRLYLALVDTGQVVYGANVYSDHKTLYMIEIDPIPLASETEVPGSNPS
jgi:hypothetical protein